MSKSNAELQADNDALLERLELAELALEEANAKAAAVPAPKVYKMTKDYSHKAVGRGYLGGVLIEDNATIPADYPVSDEWMKELTAKEAKRRAAADEAPEELDDDS